MHLLLLSIIYKFCSYAYHEVLKYISFLDESIFYGSHIPWIKYAYCIYLRDVLMQIMKASHLLAMAPSCRNIN